MTTLVCENKKYIQTMRKGSRLESGRLGPGSNVTPHWLCTIGLITQRRKFSNQTRILPLSLLVLFPYAVCCVFQTFNFLIFNM
jgi:hypothetical protein